jgi:threonine/homoserine/homoserine lactone efflux protein
MATDRLLAFAPTALVLIAVAFGVGVLVRRSVELFTALKLVGAAYLIFLAVLPQFLDRGAGGVTLQLLVLGAVFYAIALVCDSLWAIAAGSARLWFARSPSRLAAIGGVGGVAMIGIGASLALTGRKN